jgi:hypothetical protein
MLDAPADPECPEFVVGGFGMDEVIPTHRTTATKTGKLSERKLAVGARNEAYQDYICGLALRMARNALASLPVQKCVVTVTDERVDTGTGHTSPIPILWFRATRAHMASVLWEHVDASDALSVVEHKMNFKARGGMQPIELVASKRAVRTMNRST